MSSVSKDNLMRVLPAPLSKDSGMAQLGETAATALAALWQKVGIPNLYAHIDELPEAVLDILARDFKVDWYDYNYSLRTKRALIKSAIYVHKHMGTVSAVEQALSDVWPPSSVEEWFQYGGAPYHFRIILEAQSDEKPINVDSALSVVHFYKPVRSHLQNNLPIVRVTFGIEIQTGRTCHKYSVRAAGTRPRWATHGNKMGETLNIESAATSAKYHAPATGQTAAGTNPHVATHGNKMGEMLDVESAAASVEYNVPVTGQSTAGTHPNIAQHASTDDNGLKVGASMLATAYGVRPCGTYRYSLL